VDADRAVLGGLFLCSLLAYGIGMGVTGKGSLWDALVGGLFGPWGVVAVLVARTTLFFVGQSKQSCRKSPMQLCHLCMHEVRPNEESRVDTTGRVVHAHCAQEFAWPLAS